MDKVNEILEQITWVHVVAAVALYAFYCFYFQDTSPLEARENRLQGTQSQVKIIERKIDEAIRFEKEYEQKKAELAQLETEMRKKRAELPKAFNVPELLNDLFREAQQVGLEVVNVAPANAESRKELFASLQIDLNAKGTFLQMFIFLDRLSKLKRLVGVTTVELTTQSSERISLKGVAAAFSGKRLTGAEKTYQAISAKIVLLAYRII